MFYFTTSVVFTATTLHLCVAFNDMLTHCSVRTWTKRHDSCRSTVGSQLCDPLSRETSVDWVRCLRVQQRHTDAADIVPGMIDRSFGLATNSLLSVVEGAIDRVALHQCGVESATLGDFCTAHRNHILLTYLLASLMRVAGEAVSACGIRFGPPRSWQKLLFADPVKKAVQSYRKRLKEYLKLGGGHYQYLLFKKCSYLRCLYCLLFYYYYSIIILLFLLFYYTYLAIAGTVFGATCINSDNF